MLTLAALGDQQRQTYIAFRALLGWGKVSVGLITTSVLATRSVKN